MLILLRNLANSPPKQITEATNNIEEFFNLLYEAQRNGLLTDIVEALFHGKHKYDEKDIFYICDNITSIRPLIDVLTITIKESGRKINSFMEELKKKYNTEADTSTRDPNYNRIRKFSKKFHYNFSLKYNNSSPIYPSLCFYFHEPNRDLIIDIINLVEKYDLSHSISQVEFTFDISTNEIEYTFDALSHWLIKKSANKAAWCFSSSNDKVFGINGTKYMKM